MSAPLVPEPFLGNPQAPVVLLGLNPGFIPEDIVFHDKPDYHEAAVENLRHGNPEYPFYLLNPNFRDSPGHKWWYKHLRSLIEKSSLELVASRVFAVEIHGYHSEKFGRGLRVQSQDYTRKLIRDAIARKARMVIMRGRREWESLVPDIALASDLIVPVNSIQNPTISPKNCSGFSTILSAVRGEA